MGETVACKFTIEFRGSAEDLFRRAKLKIEERRGSLTREAEGGEFKIPTPVGPIQGRYEIEAQNIAFDIRRRPMMISCKMIEERLRAMLGDG